ncbi:MAG: DUF2065 family protein [Cognatishimia activa]|uniref:DUF2065 family protein n=1 Tax=Cognatishimia activa TaxID=1715691 RepID=A0A975I7R3_9RHOB|nr:DUF2065 family protein [Cognatishimia activa]QTN36448.1 DUF2065 family protein [Cognatishimia activa]
MIETILLALGLVLILEGLVYALAPSLIEELLKALQSLSIAQRRQIGILVLALGVVVIVMARQFG